MHEWCTLEKKNIAQYPLEWTTVMTGVYAYSVWALLQLSSTWRSKCRKRGKLWKVQIRAENMSRSSYRAFQIPSSLDTIAFGVEQNYKAQISSLYSWADWNHQTKYLKLSQIWVITSSTREARHYMSRVSYYSPEAGQELHKEYLEHKKYVNLVRLLGKRFFLPILQ